MPNYDFKSLSPYDFQDLVRDLLQKEFNITLECFTAGRDGGIDLCYNDGSDCQILIQVKHYPDSRYSKLKSDLRNKELDKVKRISPKRYIVATSVGLTPKNKSEIMNIFNPYILSTEDIFGKSNLNNLLGKYPDIEIQNFKLWLTSTPLLNKFLHNSIITISNMELNELRSKLKYFVRNENLNVASRLLEQQHICIIAGIPGIGKTMLARALIMEYMSKEYKLITISRNISEAFEIYDENQNQIFYYDDFLGQTSLPAKFGKNEELNISKLMDQVSRSPNKRLILTTREYILNRAKMTYEKLDHSCRDHYRFSIDLSSYSDFDRAKILFNHLYFSGVSQEYIDVLCENNGYLKIIYHENYNPRLIENMTEQASMFAPKREDYLNKFLEILDNPKELWDHPFNYQISENSRRLILVLSTLPEIVFCEDLKMSLDKFNQVISPNCSSSNGLQEFRTSIKELDGNFVKIEKSSSQFLIQFHNPSIRDFIENYLRCNSQLADSLFDSIIYYNQCENLCNYLSDSNSGKLVEAMVRTFESVECNISKPWYPNSKAEEDQLWQRDEIVIESRLLYAISICGKVKGSFNDRIINDLFKQCINKIDSLKMINKDEFSIIIDHLLKTKFPFDDDAKELLLKVKPYYFKKYIGNLEDVTNVIALIQIFPCVVNEDEVINLKKQFLKFYEYFVQELDHVWDYDSIIIPDDYRLNIDYLNKITLFFDVDVNNGIEKLNMIGQRFEKEMLEGLEDYSADLDYESWRENGGPEKERIDKMFSELKDK
jgi:hypothetical protein